MGEKLLTIPLKAKTKQECHFAFRYYFLSSEPELSCYWLRRELSKFDGYKLNLPKKSRIFLNSKNNCLM